MGTDRTLQLKAHVEALAREAGASGRVPEGVARYAARATLRWLRAAPDGGRDVARSRVRSYFWAVVRRHALAGHPGLRGYRLRCVADTLAADMLEAGHRTEAVVEELTRALGSGHAREWAESVA